MTVNILGTEYKILLDCDEDDMPIGSDGCCDHSNHTIKIMRIPVDRNSVKDISAYTKKVLRHEIIHAFLHESGVWSCSCAVDAWAMSEEMVDWIAIQSPKMLKAFKEVDCL